MSSELELVFKSLLNNEVPASWSAVAYPSLKPLAGWVKDLKQRINKLATWIEDGQPPYFWLPGFFFPQGFLTGVLQNHARRYNIPIDSLMFAFKMSDYEEGDPRVANDPSVAGEKNDRDLLGSPDELAITYPEEDGGVLISGLFIEGARWDRMKHLLQDSFPMEMFSALPMIRFVPTQIKQEGPSLYICPMYKTSSRAGTLSTTGHSTNFVISINLPSDKPADYWIAKGVALLCQLND
ncbi:dynein heavy chain domain-containing protein [Chytridium lagenaria]|nr:dynein heavy chain domain-containing protein [Chytridium lagenaria]